MINRDDRIKSQEEIAKDRSRRKNQLQAEYNNALENKTSLYSMEIKPIEKELKEKFGDDYTDALVLFEYIESYKLSKDWYTDKDMLSIKIGRFLQHLNSIIVNREREDNEFKRQIQQQEMYL